MKRVEITPPSEVIIIGAGLAGMIAACAAEAEGARVLILDRSALGLGTNSALSNGVFAGPTRGYSEEAYVAAMEALSSPPRVKGMPPTDAGFFYSPQE